MAIIHDKFFVSMDDFKYDLIQLAKKMEDAVEIDYVSIDKLVTIETVKGETLNVLDITVREEDGVIVEIKLEVE